MKNSIIIKRKFLFIAIFTAISLVSLIYWSSNTEFNDTIRVLKRNSYFIKNNLIDPFNTTCKNSPFLVILVTSYVAHVELRSAHRRAMPFDLLKSINATRIFLLAKIPITEKYMTQEAINDESNTFGDILQGAFVENYKNLTYKHLMGIQWASTKCNKASFILKVDDDTVFNLERTYKLLKDHNLDNSMIGYMLNNTKPRRNKENKWYVTWDEYQRLEYPPYFSGWYYITTPKVAELISNEAVYHPYFWIDDIFVTGLLTEALGIRLRQLPKDFWLEYYELLECCMRDMINEFIMCDYVVGPNGGRNNLIYEFNKAVRDCNSWRNCSSRTVEQSLNKVCVAYRQRNIFSDGNAEVHYLKL